MPKANKKCKDTPEQIEQQAGSKQKFLHNMYPWTFRPMPGGMMIEAYIEGDDWQTIAEIKQLHSIDAEKIAAYIVKTVNNNERQQNLIGELVNALKLALECKGITWEVEQEAESVLRKFRQYFPHA